MKVDEITQGIHTEWREQMVRENRIVKKTGEEGWEVMRKVWGELGECGLSETRKNILRNEWLMASNLMFI